MPLKRRRSTFKFSKINTHNMAEVRSYVAGEALATLRFLKVIYGNIS